MWPWCHGCPWCLITGSRFPADNLFCLADTPSPFFCSFSSALSFPTFSILSLKQARSCQSLNSQPSSPRPEQAHPFSPQPPHPTSADSSCSAETCPNFPIDDSWIRPGEALAARARGRVGDNSPSLASQCPQAQLSSFLSLESLLAL